MGDDDVCASSAATHDQRRDPPLADTSSVSRIREPRPAHYAKLCLFRGSNHTAARRITLSITCSYTGSCLDHAATDSPTSATSIAEITWTAAARSLSEFLTMRRKKEHNQKHLTSPIGSPIGLAHTSQLTILKLFFILITFVLSRTSTPIFI